VTYSLLNLCFMILAALIAWPMLKNRELKPIAITVLILLGITAVGDNLIIGFGIVAYDAQKILGWMIGLAPIEDFAYAVVAAVLVPAIWLTLEGRKK